MTGWWCAQRAGATAVRSCTVDFVVVLCAIPVLLLCAFSASARQNAIESASPPQQQSQPLAASISGHVYRADTGAPLSGAIVTFFKVPMPGTPRQPNIPEWQAARTKADGSYSLAVDSGLYHVEAKHSGFAKGIAAPVRVAAGQAVPAGDFRLQAAGSISSVVHDQDGHAVNYLPVTEIWEPKSPPANAILTDIRGHFHISGLPPAECYVILGQPRPGRDEGFYAVWYPNGDSRDAAKTVQVKPGEDMDIQFNIRVRPDGSIEPGGSEQTQNAQPPQSFAPQDAATGSVSGSVYDQDGVAIEGATIISTCDATPAGRGPQPGIHLTDDHGNFTLSGLSPGDCYISAAPDSDMAMAGYQGAFYPDAKARDAAKPVLVKAGEEIRDVRITLPYFPIFDIRVKVVEKAGAAPQSRYMIEAVPDDISQRVPVRRHLLPLITGADGVGVLRGMTPGAYRVRIIPASISRGGGVGMAGPEVGTASVQVTNANVSVSIPISVFPNNPPNSSK
jgi:hypothetical protein